jgi:hypothetical protein
MSRPSVETRIPSYYCRVKLTSESGAQASAASARARARSGRRTVDYSRAENPRVADLQPIGVAAPPPHTSGGALAAGPGREIIGAFAGRAGGRRVRDASPIAGSA